MSHEEDGLMSSPEVCRKAGITYRQLDYWSRTGLVQPVAEAAGSGTRRRFDERGLWECRLVSALIGTGPAGTTTAAIRRAREQLDITAGPYALVTEEGILRQARDTASVGEGVIDLLHDGHRNVKVVILGPEANGATTRVA